YIRMSKTGGSRSSLAHDGETLVVRNESSTGSLSLQTKSTNRLSIDSAGAVFIDQSLGVNGYIATNSDLVALGTTKLGYKGGSLGGVTVDTSGISAFTIASLPYADRDHYPLTSQITLGTGAGGTSYL